MTKKIKSPRIVSAVAICDGHDASIHLVNSFLRNHNIEVIYLGFNKSPELIVRAAIQEDADGICISSYNGGHVSFIHEILRLLHNAGIKDKLIYVGGGGTISLDEAKKIEASGVKRVFRPGVAMPEICELIKKDILSNTISKAPKFISNNSLSADYALARELTEAMKLPGKSSKKKWPKSMHVIGFSGKGGAGKSTLLDELICQFIQETNLKIAIISSDPTLGDRIRMNYINSPKIYMRSYLTDPNSGGLYLGLETSLSVLGENHFDVVFVESAGTGQRDENIIDYTDLSIFVMTPDYGTDIQLEKEIMLKKAAIVVLNKADTVGASTKFKRIKNFCPKAKTFLLQATNHQDCEIHNLFQCLLEEILPKNIKKKKTPIQSSKDPDIVPHNRRNYLGDIAQIIRKYHKETEKEVLKLRQDSKAAAQIMADWEELKNSLNFQGDPNNLDPKKFSLEGDTIFRNINEKIKIPVLRKTPINTWLQVICLPPIDEAGAIYRFLRTENIPGRYPFTEGAFPYRRRDEDPARMFAGLALAEDTNERFFLLNRENDSFRISTAYDGPTLYGIDSDEPGIINKVGEGGVAIDTYEDVERLYKNIDMNKSSISMTINGPAPILFAMLVRSTLNQKLPINILRGTVQADILKEVQAQNECIFPMDKAIKMLGDMIEYTLENIPKFYPISISGYHIGEAGANPIQELAYTLVNGLTYAEYLLNRGMDIDTLSNRLSFFFTSGSDLEFNVLGRVARRIWAIAMKERYKGSAKAQRLKFHTQTSGRTLIEREPLNNLMRVTMQAERALHNNTNSLHTNSYKEAYTTPDEDDAILALACQQIPLKEMGDFNYIENISQGGYGILELTNKVEEAVLKIFDEIDHEGGALGAIESEYFRTGIQQSSHNYEAEVYTGERKIVGLNYMVNENIPLPSDPLVRTPLKKQKLQISRLKTFKKKHEKQAKIQLEKLRKVIISGENIFTELIDTVEFCSLGQITDLMHQEWGYFRPGK